jgi:hypothetical protein
MSIPKSIENSCQKKTDYDSDEDLEHLMKVTISKGNKSNHSQTSLIENDEAICKNGKLKLEMIDRSTSSIIRFFNILSIFVLLISFFSTSISRINTNNNYDILMDYLKRDKIQSEGNLLILYIAFLFVTCIYILLSEFDIGFVSQSYNFKRKRLFSCRCAYCHFFTF